MSLLKKIYNWLFKTTPILTIEELIFIADTPVRLSRWITQNIEYRSMMDKRSGLDRDKWIAGNDTLKKGYGNCRSLAILSFEVLKGLGYDAHILELTPPDHSNGHAICAYNDGKIWRYLSNGELFNCHKYIKTLKAVGAYVESGWECVEKDTKGYIV